MPDATRTSPPPFRFDRQGRGTATALSVALVWAVLITALFWLEAAPLIIGALALFTLPALRDLITNPKAGFALERDRLRWHSGRHDAEVALDRIDHIRLDTRLDLSVRASVVLHTGRRIRIPFEATPPHRDLETALHARAIPTQRHHFSLMQ